jgi:hypothetical protein
LFYGSKWSQSTFCPKIDNYISILNHRRFFVRNFTDWFIENVIAAFYFDGYLFFTPYPNTNSH